jgi:SOS-response transcriptional repressor LexA
MKHTSPDLITRKEGDKTRNLIVFVIAEHWRHYGYSPTIRDIGAAIGSQSTGHVNHHLAILRLEGRVTWAEANGHMLPRTMKVLP